MTPADADVILQSEAVRTRTHANGESCGFRKWTRSRVEKDVTTMSNQSIVCILINVLVLCLVWGTVLAGLILVVRDKVEDDDLAQYR